MNIKTLEELENQAWNLRVKLNRMIESECIGRSARVTPSVRKERLNHAHARAYSRFLRRQDKRFS
jgi:hypothetical protein